MREGRFVAAAKHPYTRASGEERRVGGVEKNISHTFLIEKVKEPGEEIKTMSMVVH